MHVELDIFSGRPNPTWTLTDAQREEFLETLRTLPKSSAQPPVNDGLGYRGFVVTDTGATDFDKAIVYKGHVTVDRGRQATVLIDAQRELEQRLLQNAKAHLDSALFRAVSGQVMP